INPVAPEPSVASNGLHTHFCHPGAAVAHTLSALEMPSQLAATVRKCAYPHACVCTTAFGFPVVPDVYGKKAISSFEGEEKSSDSDAFSLSSSKYCQSFTSSPMENLISSPYSLIPSHLSLIVGYLTTPLIPPCVTRYCKSFVVN